ncbi:MAG: hypothetical protein PUF17_01190 [Lactimicrobium massiliense]|nr:hypothetical protein [Lactimicrobium massiliense]MDD6559567.1 hypothetical protein [Lactimicrobium massiliense]
MKIHKSKLIHKWIAIGLALFLSCLTIQPILAKGTSLTLRVPINVVFSSSGLSVEKTYQVILTGDTGSEPMPEEAQGNQDIIEIAKADGTDYAIEISFEGVGDYWYHLKAIDNDNNELGNWYMHVMIQNIYGDMTITTTVHDNTKTGEKTSDITLVDKHQPNGPGTDDNTPTPETPAIETPKPTIPANSTTGVQTGVSTNVLPWEIALFFSLCGLLVIVGYLIREREKQE